MESTFENITKILSDQYGLNVNSVKKLSVGAGSDTWFVTCTDGKYVVKYPSESDINNPELESKLCEYLLQQGIPSCQFLKNVHGEYISYDEKNRVFHAVLKNYEGLPTGMGEGFFRFMTPERALSSYRESLKSAQMENDTEAAADLLYRID